MGRIFIVTDTNLVEKFRLNRLRPSAIWLPRSGGAVIARGHVTRVRVAHRA